MTNLKLTIDGGDPIRKTMLPFGRPDLKDEEIQSVSEVIRSRWIGTGPLVPQFEETIKKLIGAKTVVATNSASAAIHTALFASDIGNGDEVITTPITFPSTINMIENLSAKPVFVDVEEDSGLIDPYLIAKAITKKTKAILPVHLYGSPCDMDKIWGLAKLFNLIVIEDAAEALGAEYKNKKIGSKGDFAAFSFAVNKLITTAEGGVITTNRKDLENKIKMLVLHGMSKNALKKYPYKGFQEHFVEIPGYKYNMTDIHAAIGLQQLARIEELIRRRDELWKLYNERLQGLPLKTPPNPPKENKHGRCFYAVQLDLEQLTVDRSTIQQAMLAENIGTAIHFFPMHLQPYYSKKYGYKKGDFPNAEALAEKTLSLPLATDLTDQDIQEVIMVLRKVLSHFSKNKQIQKSPNGIDKKQKEISTHVSPIITTP